MEGYSYVIGEMHTANTLQTILILWGEKMSGPKLLLILPLFAVNLVWIVESLTISISTNSKIIKF